MNHQIPPREENRIVRARPRRATASASEESKPARTKKRTKTLSVNPKELSEIGIKEIKLIIGSMNMISTT
jgi:hypothetical protein